MENKFAENLKQQGLSLTSVRLAVLQALQDNPHTDAHNIFENVKKQIPTTSIQAVYNNLNTLVEHQLIREIKPKGQVSRYETRINDNHHHIVCKSCGHIADTDCHSFAPCLSPMNNNGFVIEEAEVIFWGTCPSCQNK